MQTIACSSSRRCISVMEHLSGKRKVASSFPAQSSIFAGWLLVITRLVATPDPMRPCGFTPLQVSASLWWTLTDMGHDPSAPLMRDIYMLYNIIYIYYTGVKTSMVPTQHVNRTIRKMNKRGENKQRKTNRFSFVFLLYIFCGLLVVFSVF